MTHELTRRTALVGTATLSGLGLLTGRAAAEAAGSIPRPELIGCATWGATAPAEPIKLVGPPTKVIVHHTDTPNVTDYSQSAAHSIARSIQHHHIATNGWSDTGQHFTISRGGFVLEGRHRTIEGLNGGLRQFPQGAHTSEENETSLGIEVEGRYLDTKPRTAQWDALVGLCAYLCQTYALRPNAISGHRDHLATSCPGDTFYATLPALREQVATKLGVGGANDRHWPVIRPGDNGFRVTSAQHLLRNAGHNVVVDGTFDSEMTTEVAKFQTSKGLLADSVIGLKTWESPLAIKVRDGDRGDAVRGLQVALRERQPDEESPLTVDGVFGSGTLRALKAYQASVSIAADGVAGLDTWSRILRP